MQEIYNLIAPGWLYQTNLTSVPIVYDTTYVSTRYNTYPLTREMSKLRYDKMMEFTDSKSVLDVGYGNGSFLEYCYQKGLSCFGNDISDYPLPEKVSFTKDITIPVDTVTFFDSIEHFQTPELWKILRSLTAKWVLISVPWCHYIDDLKNFKHWKHRRPNEHFHHFNPLGLSYLLNKSGYKILDLSNIEDKIRKPVDNKENILTVIAKNIRV